MAPTAAPPRYRVAVYLGDRRLAVEDRDRRDPGPGEVVLEISHCGICGSDLHFVFEGWGRPGSVEGHEYSGRVAAVGPGVEGWQVGDEAVGGADPACGACDHCRAGRSSLCRRRGTVGEGDLATEGAFAQYKVLRATALRRLPAGLSLRHAALTEPLAVALHGITRAGVAAGSRVLVTGAGPIGALSVAALRALGIDDVVVSEPSARRRALAERLGATAVATGELHAPRSPNYVVDEPFEAAVECSGHAAAMEAALGQLDRAGTLVLVGAGMVPPRLDPNRILLNELVVTGAYCYDDHGFEAALAMLARAEFPADVLLEPDDVGLDGILGAIEALAAGELAGKVLVAPHLGGAAR